MAQVLPPLILINLAVLLGIGMIRQANPFEIGIVAFVLLGNAMLFGVMAILLHGNSFSAISALVTNLLPTVVVLSGIALLLWMISYRPRKSRPRL